MTLNKTTPTYDFYINLFQCRASVLVRVFLCHLNFVFI